MGNFKYCGIVRCPNNQGIKDADCTLFKPKDPDIINKWKIALENLGLECSNYRPMICSLHFRPDDFILGKKKLRHGAVPSIGHIPALNEMESDIEPSSPLIQDDIKIEFPLEMVELKMLPEYGIDVAPSTQDDKKMLETMNNTVNHLENRTETSDHCTECTKNLTKMQFLEKNNENLRKKYKKLLREVSDLRKAQNQNGPSFDDDCTMMTENEMDDYEEWCEVCWKKTDNLQQHICMDYVKEVRCDHCSVLLKSTIDLRDHLLEANHPHPKMHKCETCTLEYPSALLLIFHQFSELDHSKPMDNAKTVKCYICETVFDSKPQMQLHVRNHLLVKKCEFCNKKLTFHDLGEHLCDDQETMHCEYCNIPFNSTIKLTVHLNSKHTDDVILYNCQKCTKFFKMSHLKEIHEKYHSDDEMPKPWRCEQCAKAFTTEWRLNSHMESHSKEHETTVALFVCEKCGKSFKSQTYLTRHSFVHGERKFQCPDCPAKFKRKEGLIIHRSIHQNIKYKCSQCESTFTKKETLKYHLRVVHGSTPITKNFACKQCPLKFHKSHKLKAHMRSHSGEKPFTCTYCDQKYAYKGDLNKHLKIHVGNNIYTCEECGMGFRLPTEYRRHTFEHYKKDKEKSNEN